MSLARRTMLRVLASLLACVAMVAGSLGSGAEAAGRGYALRTSTLGDGSTVTLRWNGCQVITYMVNLAAVPASRQATFVRETRQAVAVVAAATGFTFAYRGLTRAMPRTTTGITLPADIVIAYAAPRLTDLPLSGATLGWGGSISYSWKVAAAGSGYSYGAAAVRGYVVLDTPQVLAMSPGFGPGYRRGNLLLHELGHVMGLGHVSDRRLLMFDTISASTPNGFAAGDRDGLARLGRTAGCIVVPASIAPALS